MIDINGLINELGDAKARLFCLEYFNNPDNLPDFAQIFPDHIEDEQPEYQLEMMSLAGQEEIKRLLIAAPRGSGKSTITDIVVLSWFALFNKVGFSLLISDTVSQASMQLDSLRSELETNPYIRWLFGDVRGETWGSSILVIKSEYGESAIAAKGAGQKLRGLKWRQFRPGLVIIDDLENDELVESPQRRYKLERWFRFSLLRALAKESKIIYIGTVLHENALLKRIMDGEITFGPWMVRIYKALKDDGSSFWPTRYPIEYLTSIRDNPAHPDYIGTLVFAQEMQHEPASETDRIVQGGWIKYYNKYEKDQGWLQSLDIYSAVDPAIDEKEKSSKFVFHTFGVDRDGHWWHLDTVRGQMTINEQVKSILDGYRQWNSTVIGVESIAYQRVLAQLIRSEGAKMSPPVYPKVRELFTDKSKVRRMMLHSAKFEGGFIHFDKGHPETQNIVAELTRFPAEPNDAADAVMLVLETAAKKVSRAFAHKPRGL